jgi:hypothetical protein
MGAAAEEFRRTLADPLRPLAPQEASVVNADFRGAKWINILGARPI